jgi:hypothetical protein
VVGSACLAVAHASAMVAYSTVFTGQVNAECWKSVTSL